MQLNKEESGPVHQSKTSIYTNHYYIIDLWSTFVYPNGIQIMGSSMDIPWIVARILDYLACLAIQL